MVEESDGDLMGDGVNIAARLEGICEAGRDLSLRGRLSAGRAARSTKSLSISANGNSRTSPTDPSVYEIRIDSARPAPLSAPARTPTKPGPPRLSIVVLPFANLGGDSGQDYFVDGVTESLTTDLSQMSGMRVIGRNTAFSYKNKSVDLKQIGRELNVRYVLEGSVQRSANRMRVNVQLIDAESGNHLWAERFDKPVADLFDMQDEIVARLANALNAQLIMAEARRAERAPNPELDGPLFSGNERVQQRADPGQSLGGAEAVRARARARSQQRRRDCRRCLSRARSLERT